MCQVGRHKNDFVTHPSFRVYCPLSFESMKELEIIHREDGFL